MLHLFDTKIQEKNLSLVVDYDEKIPRMLVGDPVRLNQIILNLVSNAVKFTSAGKITVRVRLLKEKAKKVSVELSVIDTGIGIPENKMDKIFENFQQATSGTSRLYGGTGLGLAIARQLVEMQGGTISVKSKVDEGSTFSVKLSFQKTTTEATEKEEVVVLDSQIKNLKVLVLIGFSCWFKSFLVITMPNIAEISNTIAGCNLVKNKPAAIIAISHSLKKKSGTQ